MPQQDDLKSLIKKKKVFQSSQPIASQTLKVTDLLPSSSEGPLFGQAHKISFTMVASEPKIVMNGTVQVMLSQFTQMPRGKVQVEVVGASSFSEDENVAYDSLAFKLSKTAGKEGDILAYQLTE